MNASKSETSDGIHAPAELARRRRRLSPGEQAGLALALFGVPALAAIFAAIAAPLPPLLVVARELAMFALCACALKLGRDRIDWAAVGLGRARVGRTIALTVLALVGMAIAIALSMLAINYFKLPFGSEGPRSALPLGITALAMSRAGIVEEILYRGLAIDRIFTWTGNRVVAALVPLLVFAASHYRAGSGGVLLALLMGLAVTLVYLRWRNLWACIAAHLIVDFVPNVVLPLLSGTAGA